MRRRLDLRLSLLLAITTLGGCAALTVDVDVYKGPMANVESVRLHQLAAMAVAAQPVLYDLRYYAEQRECRSRAKTGYGTSFAKEQECSKESLILRDDGMRYQRVNGREKNLVSPQAKTIEAILALYETRAEEDSSVKRVLEPAVTAFDRAVEQMEYANDIAAQITSGKSLKDALFENVPPAGVTVERNYWCSLAGENSMPLPYRKDFAATQAKPWKSRELVAPEREFAASHESICPGDGANSQARPAFLDGRYLSRDAYYAWEASKDPATTRSGKNCAVLLDSRGIVRASVNESAFDMKKRLYCAIERAWELNREAFGVATTILEDEAKTRILGQTYVVPLAKAAATLLSPRVFRQSAAIALDRTAFSNMPVVYEAVFSRIDGAKRLEVSDYRPIRERMAQAMANPTSGNAFTRELLALSKRISADFKEQFGLLTYPLADPASGTTQADGIASNLARWSGELQAGTVSLDKGGPKVGLVDAVNRFADPAVPTLEEKEALQRTLLYFGQKVVSLGDNEVLVADDDAETQRAYTRVLQSVGNSILSNLDELVRRGSADARRFEKAKADSMVRAAELVRNLPPPLSLDGFRQAVAGSSIPPQAKSALLAKALNTSVAYDGLKEDVLANVAAQKERLRVEKELIANSEAISRCLTAFRQTDKYKNGTANEPAAELQKIIGDTFGACPGVKSDVSREVQARIDQAKSLQSLVPDIEARLTKDLGEARSREQQATLELAGWTSLVESLPTLPPALPIQTVARNLTDAPHASMIWDDLDHVLQYLHVTHVAMHGQTPYVSRIKDAQTLVARYRSNTMYLTPATSFLRNSYPSAALRPDTVERNLLLPDFLRGRNSKADAVARSVDGQFWQNVNRVRVNGGGRVNYVVTKDDIGNWYVKGYSADGSEIAKSMKNLVLFASGPGARGTLSSIPSANASPQSSPVGQTPASDAANKTPPKTASERQFDGFKKVYREESKELFKNVQAEAKEHHNTLLAALLDVHPAAPEGVRKILKDVTLSVHVSNNSTHKDLVTFDADGAAPTTTAEDFNKKTTALLGLMADFAVKRSEALRREVSLELFVAEDQWKLVREKPGKAWTVDESNADTERKVAAGNIDAQNVIKEAQQRNIANATTELFLIDDLLRSANAAAPKADANEIARLEVRRTAANKTIADANKAIGEANVKIGEETRKLREAEKRFAEATQAREKQIAKADEVQEKAKAQLERDVRAISGKSEEVLAQFLDKRGLAIDRQRRLLDVLSGKVEGN